MNWNRMQKVFCPKVGEQVWANGTKGNGSNYPLRCTVCGEKHGELSK